MRITVDQSCDMGYIYIKNNIAAGEADYRRSGANIKVSLDKNNPNKFDLIIDVGADGKILGIEVFGAKRLLPEDAYEKAEKL